MSFLRADVLMEDGVMKRASNLAINDKNGILKHSHLGCEKRWERRMYLGLAAESYQRRTGTV